MAIILVWIASEQTAFTASSLAEAAGIDKKLYCPALSAREDPGAKVGPVWLIHTKTA
jgi:hypothetical protein